MRLGKGPRARFVGERLSDAGDAGRGELPVEVPARPAYPRSDRTSPSVLVGEPGSDLEPAVEQLCLQAAHQLARAGPDLLVAVQPPQLADDRAKPHRPSTTAAASTLHAGHDPVHHGAADLGHANDPPLRQASLVVADELRANSFGSVNNTLGCMLTISSFTSGRPARARHVRAPRPADKRVRRSAPPRSPRGGDQVLDREPLRHPLAPTALPPALPRPLVRAVLADHRHGVLDHRQRFEQIGRDRV